MVSRRKQPTSLLPPAARTTIKVDPSSHNPAEPTMSHEVHQMDRPATTVIQVPSPCAITTAHDFPHRSPTTSYSQLMTFPSCTGAPGLLPQRPRSYTSTHLALLIALPLSVALHWQARHCGSLTTIRGTLPARPTGNFLTASDTSYDVGLQVDHVCPTQVAFILSLVAPQVAPTPSVDLQILCQITTHSDNEVDPSST